MSTGIRKAKKDVYDPTAPGTQFEGTSFVMQKGVLFDTISRSPIRCSQCIMREDGVAHIVGDRAYSGNGKYLGTVDVAHGNALVRGKIPPAAAPTVAAAASADRGVPNAPAAPPARKPRKTKAEKAAEKAAAEAAAAEPADDQDPGDENLDDGQDDPLNDE